MRSCIYRSWNLILARRVVFLLTQVFVFSKELLHDNHNLSKIHFKQPVHECALIKLQIFKCIWEINTDQELSGLFAYSETGKSLSSLLCRGWIISNGMSWHSQHTSSAPPPCSFASPSPRGMIAALVGVFHF